MTKREAKIMALREIVTLVGIPVSSINGVVPAHRGNRFLSDREKMLVDRACEEISWSLAKRLDRLENS